MDTGTKIAIGGAAVLGLGAGLWYFLKKDKETEEWPYGYGDQPPIPETEPLEEGGTFLPSGSWVPKAVTGAAYGTQKNSGNGAPIMPVFGTKGGTRTYGVVPRTYGVVTGKPPIVV